ncbi:hypothetical protein THAOC_04587 [Thalassiosira oceanica]|uniref:Uncharacterized protein n=1 Tax=Thalassiosira oceanica TaxID=159749 RepID=K0T876_THAOC|nr:hypothetical protein THAOC_04587 [Thalassiosira oceanica]|eukprot:EJK73770.1 hypothetical protein THAOC_04587 [Thalassiosira oceanica]
MPPQVGILSTILAHILSHAGPSTNEVHHHVHVIVSCSCWGQWVDKNLCAALLSTFHEPVCDAYSSGWKCPLSLHCEYKGLAARSRGNYRPVTSNAAASMST